MSRFQACVTTSSGGSELCSRSPSTSFGPSAARMRRISSGTESWAAAGAVRAGEALPSTPEGEALCLFVSSACALAPLAAPSLRGAAGLTPPGVAACGRTASAHARLCEVLCAERRRAQAGVAEPGSDSGGVWPPCAAPLSTDTSAASSTAAGGRSPPSTRRERFVGGAAQAGSASGGTSACTSASQVALRGRLGTPTRSSVLPALTKACSLRRRWILDLRNGASGAWHRGAHFAISAELGLDSAAVLMSSASTA
mmetsp:Transcript_78632/g.218331  ORF Transcript_78632/g.218331 Transcript_78632/m.218331 type:complete len:255 (-) Transcript_78632:18-782(-)